MTWVEHHRRDQALRSVIDLADQRRDGLLPWDEIADAAALFGTPADLLAALADALVHPTVRLDRHRAG